MSTPTGAIHLGVDVAMPAEIGEAIANFGNKYLERVFTQHERDYCHESSADRNTQLAVRFAAKEATIKALRLGTDGVDLRLIEVRRHPDGTAQIVLHGRLCEIAEEVGVETLSLSMTHADGLAVAVVVALGSSK